MKKCIARVIAVMIALTLFLGDGSIVSAVGLNESFTQTGCETSEEVSEEVAEDASEEITEDVAQENSVEISEEENAEPVSEDNTENVSEENSEENSAETGEETSEEASEESDEEVSEDSEETSEEADQKASEELSEDVSEEKMEESSEEGNEEKILKQEWFPGLSSAALIEEDNYRQKATVLECMDEVQELEEGKDCVANEIMVSVDSEELALEYAKAFNGTLKKFDTNYAVITLNADSQYQEISVKQAVIASAGDEYILPAAWPNYYNRLCDEPVVEYVEENTVGAVSYGSNDPFLIPGGEEGYQWYHSLLGTPTAWKAGYTGKGIKVGIIDTGVIDYHEDLSVVESIKIVDKSDDPMGHGTHVTGVIGATLNNAKGGAGIAPDADLYVYSAMDNSCITDDALAAAYNLILEDDLDIVNISIGSAMYNGILAELIKKNYDNGTLIVVSAGNENTNSYSYPAAYEGAISIAAIDENLCKANFSNYGDGIRYAAPGVNIWSTFFAKYPWEEEGNAYASHEGTSFSSPIVAGTAALVLQWARENNKFQEKGTGEDVDALLALMDTGAIPLKEKGLGKGYIYLPDVLGLKTESTKMEKPVFSLKAGIYNTEEITVSISAQEWCDIYYSTNGKTPTFKKGKISNGQKYTESITLSGQKTVMVKAIAVDRDDLRVSAVASAKYVLKPEVREITITSETNTFSLAKGTKLQLKAELEPAHATYKKLKWEIVGSPKGISINQKGLVSVAKNTKVNAFNVRVIVTGQDDCVKERTIGINLTEIENPIVSIKVNVNKTIIYGFRMCTSVQTKRKDGTIGDGSDIEWISENPELVRVSYENEAKEISVWAQKNVTCETYIRARAKDGSGKTYRFKVKIEYSPDIGDLINCRLKGGKLALGTSSMIDVEGYSASELNWSVSPANQGVTVKKGKITAAKNAETGLYTITARKEGTYDFGRIQIQVWHGKMKAIKFENKKESIYRIAGNYGHETSKLLPITRTGQNLDSWKVSSSNPDILEAKIDKTGDCVRITATGKGTGKVTITAVSTDGSNLKTKCVVSVENPPSDIILSYPKDSNLYMAEGEKKKFNVTYKEGFGKIGSYTKNLKWGCEENYVIDVSSNGFVTALVGNGYNDKVYIITPDGKIKKSLVIETVGKIRKMKFKEDIVCSVGDKDVVVFPEIESVGYIPPSCISCSVNDPEALFATSIGDGISIYPRKKGTYTLTIEYTKGKKKKAKTKVIIQ